MARTSVVENNREVVEILKDINEKGGVRRLEAPISYYMMRRLRDKKLLELKETARTASKGKNPSLIVVTGKGRNLIALSSRWAKNKTEAADANKA